VKAPGGDDTDTAVGDATTGPEKYADVADASWDDVAAAAAERECPDMADCGGGGEDVEYTVLLLGCESDIDIDIDGRCVDVEGVGGCWLYDRTAIVPVGERKACSEAAAGVHGVTTISLFVAPPTAVPSEP